MGKLTLLKMGLEPIPGRRGEELGRSEGARAAADGCEGTDFPIITERPGSAWPKSGSERPHTDPHDAPFGSKILFIFFAQLASDEVKLKELEDLLRDAAAALEGEKHKFCKAGLRAEELAEHVCRVRSVDGAECDCVVLLPMLVEERRTGLAFGVACVQQCGESVWTEFAHG